MGIKKNIILVTFMLSLRTFPCSFDGGFRLYTNNKPHSLPESIKYKNCNNRQISNFLNLLNDFQGALSQRIIHSELKEEKILLKKPIFVASLESLINEKVNTPKGWRIMNPNPISAKMNFFIVQPGENISISCDTCNQPGNRNLKIIRSNPISGKVDQQWAKVQVAVKGKSLVAKQNLPVNNRALNPSDFQEKEFYSISPEQFFTNKPQLVFYKLNKAVTRGSSLNFSDLSSINLIQMGRPVRVTLRSGTLVLQSKAIANQSGKLGDVIRLKNLSTNKTIIGKVTDFNKVEVEL